MIFSPALSRKIGRGEKHQTRRPVKRDREHGTPKPCRYKPGKVYAVQPGRGENAVTHIRIVQVRRERVGRITEEEARAEGFKSRAEFASYWMRLYDRGWPILEDAKCEWCDEEAVIWDDATQEWVECPHCELGVAKVEAKVPDREILERFERHHGATEVWVITFERTGDRPLFLMAGSPPIASGKARMLSRERVTPRPHREPPLTEEEARGYTAAASMALDVLEVVDELELARQRHEADERWAIFQRETAEEEQRDRASLRTEERIRRARLDAETRRRDVSRELWVLRQMMQAGRRPELIEKQLQVLERAARLERAA